MIQIANDETSINAYQKFKPNFTVCAWMRELGLFGANLMIFAYIFEHSTDTHWAYGTSLRSMAEWFGLTRQTLTRNLEKMPYVIKKSSDVADNGFYSFSYYKIDLVQLIDEFKPDSENIFADFILSYKHLLLEYFPNSVDIIESYFSTINLNPNGINNEVLLNIHTIENVINYVNAYQNESDNIEIDTLINDSLQLQLKDCNFNITNKRKSVTAKTKTVCKSGNNLNIAVTPKPPKKALSREEKRSERLRKISEYANTMYEMNANYVTMHNITDATFKDALDSYVKIVVEDTENNKGLTPTKYQKALNSLDRLVSIEDRLDFINVATIGGYSQFIFASPSEISKRNKDATNKKNILSIAEEFIKSFSDADKSFHDEIMEYVENCVLNESNGYAFKNRLKQLTDAKLTASQIITVIRDTTGSGWKTWNMTSLSGESVGNGNKNVLSVDIDVKEKSVDEFIAKHYLFLETELRDSLLKYVHETDNGRGMSVDMFRENMENLLHHRFTSKDIIASVKEAVLCNYKVLSKPDYEKEALIKKGYNTIDSFIRTDDRDRKQNCKKVLKQNPQDERFSCYDERYIATITA